MLNSTQERNYFAWRRQVLTFISKTRLLVNVDQQHKLFNSANDNLIYATVLWPGTSIIYELEGLLYL